MTNLLQELSLHKREANEIVNKLINTYIILIGFMPLSHSFTGHSGAGRR